MRTHIALSLLVAFSLAACGDDEPTFDFDVAVEDTGRTGRDTSRPTPDAEEDTTVEDTTADVGIDAVEEVVDNGECGNGVVEGTEQCDDGNDTDDDDCNNDCEVNGAGVCTECTDDIECGGPTDRCIDIAGVMMCGRDCDDDVCPRGWECVPVVRDGDILENQCKPVTGDCAICDDADEDEVCDYEDECPDGDDRVDGDGDGIPDACDDCPEDNPNDTDTDGVCDSDDICPAGNDNLDNDDDGVPDACDECPFANPDDADEDGVCGNNDRCEGFDDAIDLDMDRIPDGCDESVEICDDDIDNDGDEIVDCEDDDCRWHTACGPCDSPQAIGVGTFTGRTEGEDEMGSADDLCGSDGAPERVLEFTAEEAGLHCATTAGTGFDTVLYGRTSCGEPATEFACDDDAGTASTSEFEFDADPETPVFLVVDGFSDGDAGDFTLSVFAGSCADAAATVLCESATTVTAGTHAATLDIVSYAASTGCAGADGGEAVFAYTAVADGPVCFASEGTGTATPVDTILYIRATCDEAASEIDCNDDVDGFDYGSQVQINATEGETYFAFVDEYSAGFTGGFGGPIALTITEGACP